jgi:hypothetical protein
MYINESELRDIVREEMSKTGVSRKLREATAPAAGGNLAYKVKQGDTISAVLQSYYGIPLGKANYPLYNQVAKLSGIANADKILAQGDVLQLPPTLGGKPRKGAAAPAAGAPAAKGAQCDLPKYTNSLTTALGKAGVAGMAMTTTIELIIMGKFYNATADGLAKIARSLQTAGSESLLKSAAAVWANAATFGGSEFLKSVIIAFCNGWSSILSGCTNAKVVFSRTCDFTTFANQTAAAWGNGLSQMFAPITGGIQAVLKFLTTGAQALAQIAASVGLAALGLTAAVITGLITGLAKMIQMGAAAVQSLISGAIIAAGKVLSGAGAAVSAVGGGMQAAGGAVQTAGAAMKEGRSRSRAPKNETMQRFADDMLHAATVNRYLAGLDESTRRVILAAAV